MQRIKCLISALALTTLLCSINAAQTAQTNPNAELRIVVGNQQVLFTALRPAQELRLEIFNQAGEPVYDSGLLSLTEFTWNLRDANGAELPPGLYSYTLSLRSAEAEMPRKHPGHFIIEQGNERFWLTAKDATGVGAEVTGGELTVARTGERTVAGVSTGVRTVADGRERLSGREIEGRTLAEENQESLKTPSTINLDGGGTTNRLVKWLDGDSLTNSVVTDTGHLTIDSSSNMQAAGTGTLIIQGNVNKERIELQSAGVTPGPALQGRGFGGTIAAPSATLLNHDLFIIGGSGHNGSGLVTFNAGTVKIKAEQNWTPTANGSYINFETTPLGSPTSARAERMRINGNGNVGIGTTTPAGRLEVVRSPGLVGTLFTTAYAGNNIVVGRAAEGTQSAPTATSDGLSLLSLHGGGYAGGGFTLSSKAAINLEASQNWTSTANGTRITFDTTANGSIATSERMRINHDGNVGIGTTNPSSKLAVQDTATGGSGHIQVGALTSGGADKIITFGDQGCGEPCVYIGEQGTDDHMVLRAGTFHFKNGRVGIGTTTPDGMLHATGGANNGVHGVSTAFNGTGVYGESHTGTLAFGVFGYSISGYGVYGYTAAATQAGVLAAGSQTGIGTALQIESGGIRVLGAGLGTSTPVFIHRAVVANIAGHITRIDHPFTNGDPNAILIVTPNNNPGGGASVGNNHAIGVFYDGGAAKWTIFNQDSAAMPVNAAFNVLVIKP